MHCLLLTPPWVGYSSSSRSLLMSLILIHSFQIAFFYFAFHCSTFIFYSHGSVLFFHSVNAPYKFLQYLFVVLNICFVIFVSIGFFKLPPSITSLFYSLNLYHCSLHPYHTPYCHSKLRFYHHSIFRSYLPFKFFEFVFTSVLFPRFLFFSQDLSSFS